MKGLALAGVLLSCSIAFAQDAPDGATAPPAAPPAPAAAPPPPAPTTPPGATTTEPAATAVDPGVAADPNQDHAWYLPTGETTPAGKTVFTDWELLLVGIKHGITDSVEINGEALLPLTSDFPILIIVGAKARVIKTSNVRVAVNGNLLYLATQGSGSNDSLALGWVGGAASLCLDDGCHSLLTGGLQLFFGINTNNTTSAFVYTPSVSLIGRLGAHVKALVEADGGGYYENGRSELGKGALLMYGFRFHSDDIAGDIGFARPVCSSGCDTGKLVLGVPLVTFSYRF